MERGHHGNSLSSILGLGRHGKQNVLTLNVLLLGDRQSGRSSVGNALIGEDAFQTGICAPGVSVTMEQRLLSRNFQKYFRRQGAESDLTLRVIDTPPATAVRQAGVHALCPEGVHVLMLVVRADLPLDAHLDEHAQALFGPGWHRHALLVLTHGDHLEEAGLNASAYLAQVSDWLRALAEQVEGGVSILDNSCDWPSVRGRPLRERLLRLSARNHHRSLTPGQRSHSDARTEVSL